MAFLAASAHAWPTAQEAIDRFLAFELAGGRLRSWPFHQFLAVPEDYDEPGWDAVSVVRSHSVGPMQCEAAGCSVDVTFTYACMESRPQGGSEVVRYVAVQAGGSWLLESSNGHPRIAESEYTRRFPDGRGGSEFRGGRPGCESGSRRYDAPHGNRQP
jgi:hypothetical protein